MGGGGKGSEGNLMRIYLPYICGKCGYHRKTAADREYGINNLVEINGNICPKCGNEMNVGDSFIHINLGEAV
jgi:ribosomal protein S27AE